MKLFTAIEYGEFQRVKCIVEKYPKVHNFEDYNEWNPIDCAILHGKLKIAQFLWEKGGRPSNGKYMLVHSVAERRGCTPATLKWAFEKEEVLSLDVLKIQDRRGWTPLDVAIAHGNLEMAQFLWEKCDKQHPNPQIFRGGGGNWTPMHGAAEHGCDPAILTWVFAEHVFPLNILKIKDRRGRTPFDQAIVSGHPNIAQCILEKGARPNVEEEYCHEGKVTPVHCAASYGFTATLKWLFITEKVLPLRVLAIKDKRGRTPLENAEFRKQEETAKLLRILTRGISVEETFLIIQLAKRDHRCVLRRLPDELLNKIVDQVAAHFDLVVVWS